MLAPRPDSLVASPWGPRQPEPFFDRQTRVYQIALRRDARRDLRPAELLGRERAGHPVPGGPGVGGVGKEGANDPQMGA